MLDKTEKTIVCLGLPDPAYFSEQRKKDWSRQKKNFCEKSLSGRQCTAKKSKQTFSGV